MKFSDPKCPQCGGPPTGQFEHVLGIALFTEPDEAGEVDFAGDTEMEWSETEPMESTSPRPNGVGFKRLVLWCRPCAVDWGSDLDD